ncbi:MAG: hypothetical protein P8X70_02450 [Nanoarchaeota archaeon]
MKRSKIFPKNRKGQFYLIAAIIIIAIIIGFAAVSNYAKKKEVIKLYDLGEELGIESENVLDFGTYNEYSEEDMEDLLTEFVQSYSSYATEGKNLYFLFGNNKEFHFIAYQELASDVSIDIGEGINLIQTEPGQKYDFTPENGKISEVKIIIGDLEYEFDLKPGENFYFIISQEIEGEQYVVKS